MRDVPLHRSHLITRDDRPAEEPDEAALVRAAQADPPAFLHLHRLYEDRVYQYVRVRTHSIEDAADLTQQVFLQAFDAIGGYRESGSPFAAWLFRIAHNVVADYYRGRRPTVAWDDALADTRLVSGDDVEATVLRRAEVERMNHLLARFSPEEQELVALRFRAELTLEEIASVTGSSKSSVHRRLMRVLQVLKERYSNE